MGATGFDNTFGYGRVNACRAVFEAFSSIIYVTGPFIVCTSNSTFTLHNRPPGTTVNWTRSSNLSYVSGQGTDNYTVKAHHYAPGGGQVGCKQQSLVIVVMQQFERISIWSGHLMLIRKQYNLPVLKDRGIFVQML